MSKEYFNSYVSGIIEHYIAGAKFLVSTIVLLRSFQRTTLLNVSHTWTMPLIFHM